MGAPDRTPTDLETVRERLNVVTQETRFALVQDLLGHPEGLPTLKELDYVNPSKSRTAIRQHLQRLIDAGIVEEVTLPTDRRQNDLPYKFYGIRDEGRQFLEAHDLLRAEETLREIYRRFEASASGSFGRPPVFRDQAKLKVSRTSRERSSRSVTRDRRSLEPLDPEGEANNA